jgi:hypothetical protein
VNLPEDLAIALGIVVVLPMGAVGLARRWRDPPPEKWGIPAEARAAAANTPELIAYRPRIEPGVAEQVRRLRRRAEAAVVANASA